MKIAIGCDHGALELKNALLPHLLSKGYEPVDFGTYTSTSCDYPEFAAAAAKAVACGSCEKGIVLCTTGIGVSICANKVRGIRCALLSDTKSAEMTRHHIHLGRTIVCTAILDAVRSVQLQNLSGPQCFQLTGCAAQRGRGDDVHFQRHRHIGPVHFFNMDCCHRFGDLRKFLTGIGRIRLKFRIPQPPQHLL